MSLDSQKSVPSVAGSESGEESVIKLKEEVFSKSITLLDKDLDLGNCSSTSVIGDRSFSIVVDEHSVENKFRRRPMTRSVRKSKLPGLAASSGTTTSWANAFLSGCGLRVPLTGQNPLHPPKGEIAVSFWSLEFGLRLLIQPFYRRLLVDLRVASFSA
ncbi:hypothetical protein ACOSQ2_024219 [Xanthoceras sorbifolium]